MKLHIGCGNRNLPGWSHYDIRRVDSHIDYVGSADDLSQFRDNSIEEIYACHILEHFERHKINDVLKEWYRIITPGGAVHIAVPDFAAVVAIYERFHDIDMVMGLLYGRQNYEYNYHCCTFDFDSLRVKMEEAGFRNVETYDWREFLPEGYDDYSRSYIPHMDFENGKLVSLNVKGKKPHADEQS